MLNRKIGGDYTGNKLLIKDGALIDARGMKLILDARHIEVNGTLKADKVIIRSEAGTGKYGRDFSELYDHFKEEIDFPVLGEGGGGIAAGAVKVADMLNISDEAKIVIGEHAAVYSKEDVIILAKVTQAGSIFEPGAAFDESLILNAFNVVNVKIAHATVDIAGKVYAGYDFNTDSVRSDHGSVKVDAQAEVSMGYDIAGKAIDKGYALAVSVADADASVDIRQGAEVAAAKDISIGSNTSLKSATRADSGTFGAPFAVAVAVLISDSHSTVNGKVNSRAGNVKITADGTLDAQTIADKGSGQKLISGGYAAVTVALQDVKAEVGKTGAVTGADVQVQSSAVEKVRDHAASAAVKEADSEDGGTGGLMASVLGPIKGVLKDTVWPKIKDKFKSDSAKENAGKAIEKIPGSGNSVKLDEYAEQKGVVKAEFEPGAPKLKVKVTPWEGYNIKTITIRGYNPGDTAFHTITKDIDDDEETTETFDCAWQNVIVFVDYEEKESSGSENDWQPADLFEERAQPKDDDTDLMKLIEDVQSGTDETSELDKALKDAQDANKNVKLTLEKASDGAVLTYDYLPDSPDENLKTVQLGSELRLVPNPNAGSKLKAGSLKVTYTVKEKGEDGKDKDVAKTVVVSADSKGRYIFKVPETLEMEKGLKVTAAFESSGTGKEADETQTQVTGTVAVAVAYNDGQALIAEGAVISATGKAEVVSTLKTDVNTIADGTAVSKESAPASTEKKKESYPIKRPDAEDYNGYDKEGHFLFGLILDESINGTVTDQKGEGEYAYSFTPNPVDGYSVAGAKVSYYDGGTLKTVELAPDEQGKYQVAIVKDGDKYVLDTKCLKNGGKDDKGDQQTFSVDKGTKATVSFSFSKEGEYKGGENARTLIPHIIGISYNSLKGDGNETGTIEYKETKDESGKKLYVFEATPKTEQGYILEDGKLKASWTDPNTLASGEVELEKKDGLWYLDASQLPEGVKVKVSGKFVGDFHSLTFDQDKVTTDDKTPLEGAVKDASGETEGTVTLSETNVSTGDKVAVNLTEDKAKAGYKITKVEVKDATTGKTVATSENGSFTVPEDTDSQAKLTVTAEIAPKEIKVEESKLTNGSVKPSIPLADQGETVTVTVKPADGFRVKKGTLKAVITSADGRYTQEVYMFRENDTTYTFTLPEDIEDPATAKVAFAGEFEPGQSDSSAVDTSVGAGIAVAVVGSEGRADVKGSVDVGGSLNVKSSADGEIKTEAKAGYSKGNIGVGGALAVQVASIDSKALVHRSADLTLKGQLKVSADSDVAYNVGADASGSKESKKTGVGAGIAVAVNGGDTYAAVQDGVRLNSENNNIIKGISVTANKKVKDTVSAKAGANGGTAAAPVALVNVNGAGTRAYLGRIADKVNASGTVSVSASTEAAHTMSADASASGGKKEGKSADKQADGLTDIASKMAGKNQSDSVSPSKIQTASSGNRQKAETSEGTVGVAGALVVNVQQSESRSEIMDGVDVRASGLVAVTAQNGTVSRVKANASTANSDTGVGVGIAINIIGLNNIARLGDGEIEAAMLRVAAATKIKEPEKEQDSAEDEESKADDKKGIEAELGEAVAEFINDLIKDMGLDQYVSASLLSDIADEVAQSAAKELFKDTGIQELFPEGASLKDKYNEAINALSSAKDGLVSMPGLMKDIIMDALGEVMDLASLSEDAPLGAFADALLAARPGIELDMNNLPEALEEAFVDLLQDQFADVIKDKLPAAGERILTSVKDGMLEYLKDHAGDFLSGLTSGKLGDELKKLVTQAKKEIADAVQTTVRDFVSEAFEETLVTAVQSLPVPCLSVTGVDEVMDAFSNMKDAFRKERLTGIFEDAASKVVDTFNDSVFDIEKMIEDLSKVDFKKMVSENLRGAAKAASVTLTNEALSALSDHFELRLEAQEAKATGHVIDTQAIAGAGAREVGVAGSLALTVLNSVTKATIAENGKSIIVSGDMTVEANELRTVRNVASAAIDAKGDAASNKSAGSEETKDAGAGSDAESIARNKDETVKLTVGVGGEAVILSGDRADNRPKMRIELKDGYKLPEGNKAQYSYTNKSGFEVSGTVEIQKDDVGWYIDTKSGDLAKAEDDAVITLEVRPEEKLNAIAQPEVLSDLDIEEGAVSVSVKGRDVETDGDGNPTLSAKPGDLVEIKIAKADGRKVSWVGYSWKDGDGQSHDVELNTSRDGEKVRQKEFTLVSSNEKELIYTFTMPDGEVDAIAVAYEEGEEEKAESETAAKDNTGKSVGVGAAFSMVYGDNETSATVGERGWLNVGSLNVTAASDHTEDIASAAGTDPLEGDTNPDEAKDISLDASVALNILDTGVKAGVAAGNIIDTTDEESGDLKITANENGVTKTTSSAFAVGGRTAVGASVAVNIASSSVSAAMDGEARVMGSAEVSAASHSEDDIHAIATAMGAISRAR